MMEIQDHRPYLDKAKALAGLSPDPSTKCSALVVRPTGLIIGAGYNAFPKGVKQTAERWSNRQLKYQIVIHAEMMAILQSGDECRGAHLYTHTPGWGPCCERCAVHIIQAGIVRIVCLQEHLQWHERSEMQCKFAMELLAEAGVGVLSV